jgi:cytidylate kinase
LKESVIAIDGPVGSGKTTLGLGLARELNADFIDTGYTFRALAFEALRRDINIEDPEEISELLHSVSIRHGCQRVSTAGSTNLKPTLSVNGVVVTEMLFTEDVADLASRLSAIREIRAFAVELWREAVGERLLVAVGRDLTSVVFPNAMLKIYLDCPLDERARRRARQLSSSGTDVSVEEVRLKLAARDERDTKREVSPLVMTVDSCYICNHKLTREQTLDIALGFIDSLPLRGNARSS